MASKGKGLEGDVTNPKAIDKGEVLVRVSINIWLPLSKIDRPVS